MVRDSVIWTLLLCFLAGSPTAADFGLRPPAPAGSGPAEGGSFSAADCDRLASLRAALEEEKARAALWEGLLAQIRRIPPVAVVEGFWVTPVDLPLLLARLDISPTPEGPAAAATAPGEEASRPGELDPLALAFTADRLRGSIPLPRVGKLERDWPPQSAEGGVMVIATKDVEEALAHYLPPIPEGEPAECYFFCGDPAAWDFDADGEPNDADPDDDGDGVADGEDDYPYWLGDSDCGCDADFVGLIDKFSAGVTRAVLEAFGRLEPARSSGRLVPIAVPAAADSPVASFVFPGLAECPGPSGCPNPDAPGVGYVSRDPEACARLRFFCEEGASPFSDSCGCGCRRETT